MRKAFRLLLGLLALVVAQAAMAGGNLSGTVAFRDAGVVPDGATLRVVLLDVSQGAEAPVRVLGEAGQPVAGPPPYRFEISYDPAAIRPAGTYVLRAELVEEGRVLFRSRGLLPVITRGGSDPQLWLARASGASDPLPGDGPLRFPVSFGGDLPCRNCKSVRYRLNLWADHVFYLRRVWEGKDMRRDAVGRWSLAPGTGRLTLDGADEDLQFDVLGSGQLRLVTKDGPSPDGKDVLVASPAFQQFEPHLPLRGLVTWMGSEAKIVECATGRQFPLVEDGDFDSLEHAYLAAAVEPGSSLMASFDGAIVQEPGKSGPQAKVLVERFDGVWPGETCERATSPATLRNTYWRILRLGDAEVGPSPERREPSLILREGESRFAATIGCNQLTGRYVQADGHLRFVPAAITAATCPAPLDDWERKLEGVLADTAGWRIKGQSLQLLDETGEQLALLQAVYLY